MIIAGRNRGRIHATSATLQPTALGGRRRGGRALSPTPHTTPEPRSLIHLRDLRAKALGFDMQAMVPLALLALALTAFIPGVHFELQTASDLSAVETAATLISALAAVLFFDRFWRHLRLRSLLLAGGLAVMAVSNLGAGLLLAGNLVIAGHSAAWVVLGGRLAGWVLIAGSAVVPDSRLRRPSRAQIRKILLRTAAVVLPVIAIVALNARTTSYNILHGEPLSNPTATLVVQILLAAITTVAAAAFRSEVHHDGSPPARLLALACAFAAASALAACATPSFYASHVGIADVLRLGWLVALFACVCVEWSLDERHAPVHALARERQRMAADVHDLIMQDLSFALANARTLADDPARAESVSTVVSAGERALAGARDVVSGLTEQSSQPIVEAVEASARTAARHTPLTFRVERAGVEAQPDEPTRDALVHIAREAVTNAVKHGRPQSIEVTLEHQDEWRLQVRDDGRGFDRTAHRGGFGLSSMHRQAESLGGTLRVGATDQGGTTVEAALP
jgi:signal transduction histidine kinase